MEKENVENVENVEKAENAGKAGKALYEIKAVAELTGKRVQDIQYLVSKGYIEFRRKRGVFITERGLEQAMNRPPKREYKRKK